MKESLRDFQQEINWRVQSLKERWIETVKRYNATFAQAGVVPGEQSVKEILAMGEYDAFTVSRLAENLGFLRGLTVGREMKEKALPRPPV